MNHPMGSRPKLCLAVLLISLLSTKFLWSDASKCESNNRSKVQPGGECSSIIVKDAVDELKQLENCTVIEGYLRISLLMRVGTEEFAPYSFPMLREITDHLVLYRVYGLKSLRQLFPNLAVIRGQVLFANYALVVYESNDLEDLGLINLQNISRGGVRLTKNTKLCYVDTVDWERIGVGPEEQDFKYNREESQCANFCPPKCDSTSVDGISAKRCWTSQHCQKHLNCNKNCDKNQVCMDNGECCDAQCLGGCTGKSALDCHICKNVRNQNLCLAKCPPPTYMFFQRRCLSDIQCSNMTDVISQNKGVLYNGDKAKNEPKQCLFTCPANYVIEEEEKEKPGKDGKFNSRKCVRCEGPCPKKCSGRHITSIQAAQEFTGCSKIEGNIEIEILRGVTVADELENGLGLIKEITGRLAITNSFPLMNLFFLKSLENITGDDEEYSLTIKNNQNIQELFPEERMKKMTIGKKVQIRENEKLCKSKIRQFQEYLNLKDDMLDSDKNGDRVPCEDKHLNMTISSITHNYVVLSWERLLLGDTRRVLSYIINYKEIKDETVNVNIFQGRDACSDDVWMTKETSDSDKGGDTLKTVVSHLKPFTTYAVYIQAYTLSTAQYSAMTKVEIFTTNPYNPSKPKDLEVTAKGAHKLHIKWSKPKEPNGIIDHYVVSYQREELNGKEFDKRDYCDFPVVATKKKVKKEEEDRPVYNISSNCCACPKSKSELEAEAKKQEMDIYFEDFLHGLVYCKRFEALPFKLNDDILDINLHDLSESDIKIDDFYDANDKNISDKESHGRGKYTISAGRQEQDQNLTSSNSVTETRNDLPKKNQTSTVSGSREVIVNDTELILEDLEHFREYSIMVKACHEQPVSGDEKLCSTRAIAQGRTEALRTFDRINTSTIEVTRVTNMSRDVLIKWGLPTNPNGLTVKFMLFFKQVNNQENLVARQVCVSMQKYYKHSGFRLTGLAPGNWTFQIRPVSLGGDGVLTPPRYFDISILPGGEPWQTGTIVAIASICLGIVVVVVCALVVARNRLRKEDMTVISQNINYIPSEPAYIMDGWEVDRSKIRTIREIGQGSFGMVYEGIATGLGDDPNEEIKVAVKTVNDRAGFNDRREFLKEATTMKAFDCFHVVKLLGVVSTGQPALVIMELMAHGDLKNYLREHRPDEDNPDVTPPCLQDILQMAGEVADGMAYLADKKFVHRDLAARNCMVAEDKTVKIGDFGMTRDIYETDYYRKGGKGMLPVRWMAPESLKDGIFSSMSDVWSYGVVIWEMVTLAAQPYQGLSNDQVIKFITDGSTMDMPERCPEEMAYLMRRCWAKRSKNRPTFKEIITYLLPHVNARFEKVSYFFSDGGGHASDAGRGLGEAEEDDSEDDDENCSIDSLSCEGAAAPRQSLKGASDYGYGSPTASADSASVYDEGIDPESYLNDEEEQLGRGKYFPNSAKLYVKDGYEKCDRFNNGHSDFGVEMNELDQPFIHDGLKDLPYLMTRQPNGPASAPHNSGLIELQPLLSSGGRQGAHPSSSPESYIPVQNYSSHPSNTPDFVDHHQRYPRHHHQHHPHHQHRSQLPASTPVADLPGSHHRPTPFSLATADPLRSGPPGSHSAELPDPEQPGHPASQGETSPAGPLLPPPSTKSSQSRAPASALARPSLRLPTLNQPPSGGFKRVSLVKPEHRDNGGGAVTGSSHLPPSDEQPLSGSANPNLETSPVLSEDPLHPSSPGAIASSSSEGSKDSGSRSTRVNGLSNGHIPMSAASSNRTTLC